MIIVKNGKNYKSNIKLKRVKLITKKISVARIKITAIAKTVHTSVEITLLNKNSLNLDKYLSKNISV